MGTHQDQLYRESENDGQKGTGRDKREKNISLAACVNAVFGDFDFGDSAEGEEKLYEVFGRLLRGLLHDMGDGVGDRGLEHHALGMEAGQVNAHELPRLQHQSPRRILPLPDPKCKVSPLGARGGDG
jgi:hypothetical protein